ncbi:hypothetical protein OIV83_000169 [Microbotryomycetes sp. JL201]|nr:hypothetical protein OIV83_000169 [Microbotryomycetes sp. JL201]
MERFRKSDEELRKMKKKTRQFYEHQNEILDGFKQVDEILDNARISAKTGNLTPYLPQGQSEREAEFERKVQLAINVNFAVNVVLLAAKIAIVVLSNSVSLVASTVDSAMDFLSTLIIFGANKVIQHKSWRSTYHYPTGKKRMEPMSVVIFSVVMTSSFVQVAIESLQRLFARDAGGPATIPPVGLAVMVATIVIKLVMWLWCRSIKNSSVEALTQDAENDIVFNLFSMLFPFVGQLLGWRVLDPIGGLLLSVYIIVEWIETLFDNVVKLTGRRAMPSEHQRVAYLLTRFSPLIRGVQHLSVYHAGDHYVVEVDIVLPPDIALTTAHDLGEAAQYSIEQLEGIDRAFVHLDVTFNPLSGHIDRSFSDLQGTVESCISGECCTMSTDPEFGPSHDGAADQPAATLTGGAAGLGWSIPEQPDPAVQFTFKRVQASKQCGAGQTSSDATCNFQVTSGVTSQPFKGARASNGGTRSFQQVAGIGSAATQPFLKAFQSGSSSLTGHKTFAKPLFPFTKTLATAGQALTSAQSGARRRMQTTVDPKQIFFSLPSTLHKPKWVRSMLQGSKIRTKIAKMTETLSHQKEMMQEMNDSLIKLEDDNALLKGEFRQKIEAAFRRHEDVEVQVQKQCQILRDHVEAVKKDDENKVETAENLRTDIAELRLMREVLVMRDAALEEKSGQLAESKERVQQLEQLLAVAETSKAGRDLHVRELEERLNTEITRKMQYEQDHQDLFATVRENENSLLDRIRALQADNEQIQKDKCTLQAELSATALSLGAREDQHSALRETLSETGKRLANLQEELAQVRQESEQQQSKAECELAAKTREINTLQNEVEELKPLKQKLETTQKELREIKQEFDSADRKLKASEAVLKREQESNERFYETQQHR